MQKSSSDFRSKKNYLKFKEGISWWVEYREYEPGKFLFYTTRCQKYYQWSNCQVYWRSIGSPVHQKYIKTSHKSQDDPDFFFFVFFDTYFSSRCCSHLKLVKNGSGLLFPRKSVMKCPNSSFKHPWKLWEKILHINICCSWLQMTKWVQGTIKPAEYEIAFF